MLLGWVCTEGQLLGSQQDRHPSSGTGLARDTAHTRGELVTPALPPSPAQGCPLGGSRGTGWGVPGQAPPELAPQLQELQ